MEILGVAFGVCLVAFSVWYAYDHVIRPARDARRREAYRQFRERRARHWWEVGRARRHRK